MSDTKPMRVKQRKIGDLIPAEYNPRQLTEPQYEQIKASLQRFGVVDPIIVNAHPKRRVPNRRLK